MTAEVAGVDLATPVVVHQAAPIDVQLWPSVPRVVLTTCAVLLGVLHAVTCIVFLYVVYAVAHAMSELSDKLSQLPGVGG